jgi:hypothetical protein
VIPIVKFEAVAFAKVQNTPGEAEVYVGRTRALKPVFVMVYKAAD